MADPDFEESVIRRPGEECWMSSSDKGSSDREGAKEIENSTRIMQTCLFLSVNVVTSMGNAMRNGDVPSGRLRRSRAKETAGTLQRAGVRSRKGDGVWRSLIIAVALGKAEVWNKLQGEDHRVFIAQE
jgi:hypothetical protein